MSKSQSLQEWKQILEISHKRHDTVKKKIKRAWDYYKGNQWAKSDGWDIAGYKDKTVDNVIFSNIRAIVPRLNFKNPKIFTRPKQKPFRTKEGMFDTLAASVYIELVLNYYYKVLGIKREARKCLYDALLSPWGIMELGYTLKTQKIQKGELLEINELIEEDSPFCVRRDPQDFRVDPECTDSNLNDCRWIGLRWVKPLEDVKKDPRYSNTSNLKANFRVKTAFDSPTGGMKVDDISEDQTLWGRVEGWTIWDRKEHRIMDIVKDHERFLRNEEEWPLEFDGFPVETLYFNENATDIYPVPDTWLCLDMQDELNRIGSLQLDHIRRISQRRYIGRENAFSEEELRKLTHGGDGTVALSSMDPETSLVPLTDATISQDIYMVRNGLKQTIQQMMGVTAAETLTATKFESATEPALIEQAAQTIRGDQQQIFENFLVRVIEKLAKIVQQTADRIEIPLTHDQINDEDIKEFLQNKMVKVAGVEGAIVLQPWLEIGKNDIQGEYIYDLEVGSTMPVNEQVVRQDAVTLYQLLEKNPFVKGREGTKEVLSAFNKPDPEKFLKPEEQVAQEQAQMKQEALQAEIAVDTPKRQADLQKTMMKTASSEKIAAMKTQGDTIKNAIDVAQGAMTHRAEMGREHEKHVMNMGHERDKHMMGMGKAAIDLGKTAQMSNIKISEAREKSKMLTNTLRGKGKKPEK